MPTPLALDVKEPCHVTGLIPPGNPPAGTWKARPLTKTSSPKPDGTVVTHSPPTFSVVALVAEVEKLIGALGTASSNGVGPTLNLIVEFAKWIVTLRPAVPLAFRWLLNQM